MEKMRFFDVLNRYAASQTDPALYVTDAAIHDSQALDDILGEASTACDAWTNSACRSAQTQAWLDDRESVSGSSLGSAHAPTTWAAPPRNSMIKPKQPSKWRRFGYRKCRLAIPYGTSGASRILRGARKLVN